MAATKKTQVTEEVKEEQVEESVLEVQTEVVETTSYVATRELERKRGLAARIATQASLSEPFSQDVERELKKGGTFLVYIPVSEVINRLNKVLGFDGWSYEIIKCERDAHDPEFIVAHVRMTVYPLTDKFTTVTRDGFGGQKIKRTKQGDIVDLGDEFKGAVSDALKKAAQSIGVGLYLARTEEAMALDDVDTVAVALQTVAPAQVAQVEQVDDVSVLYQNFIGLRQSLDEEGVAGLRTFWKQFSGGRPVPKPNEFTDAELTALIEECVRLTFKGGKFEDAPV